MRPNQTSIFQRRRENMIRMLKYFEEWHESEIFLLCCYIIVYQIEKIIRQFKLFRYCHIDKNILTVKMRFRTVPILYTGIN